MQTKRFSPDAAFTLIELLVSMTVLIILTTLVNQLVFGAGSTTTASRKRMDADNQARLIFDRMAYDFGKMLKRPDVDYVFYKQIDSSVGANDKLFFFSEAPAYLDAESASASPAVSSSGVSLVGYRIHANPDPNDPTHTKTIPQLERLGEALRWDQGTSNDSGAASADVTSGGVVFLTYPPGAATPVPGTTIAGNAVAPGNWSKTTGTAANGYEDGASPNYHVVGDQVFRLECSFLTKDGATSTKPVRQNPPSNWPAGATFYHETTDDPSLTSDSTSKYAVGSRWYNTTTGRAYICASAAPGAAVWNAAGIQDVAALIVALGILDSTSRATLADPNAIVPLLLDPTETQLSAATPPKLMASTWMRAVDDPSFAGHTGLTKAAASQVRIYQRHFYLNTP